MIPKLIPSNMENLLVFYSLLGAYFLSLRIPNSLEHEHFSIASGHSLPKEEFFCKLNSDCSLLWVGNPPITEQ